jgi:hypothetical protein
MEVLFWFVVVIIDFMGISSYCQGAYCGLSWLSVLIGITLTYVPFGSPNCLLIALRCIYPLLLEERIVE